MWTVLLTPIEDGYWLAEVPSLPGCHTQGETREEALEMIKDAIDLYLETLKDLGRPIPANIVEVEMVA